MLNTKIRKYWYRLFPDKKPSIHSEISKGHGLKILDDICEGVNISDFLMDDTGKVLDILSFHYPVHVVQKLQSKSLLTKEIVDLACYQNGCAILAIEDPNLIDIVTIAIATKTYPNALMKLREMDKDKLSDHSIRILLSENPELYKTISNYVKIPLHIALEFVKYHPRLYNTVASTRDDFEEIVEIAAQASAKDSSLIEHLEPNILKNKKYLTILTEKQLSHLRFIPIKYLGKKNIMAMVKVNARAVIHLNGKIPRACLMKAMSLDKYLEEDIIHYVYEDDVEGYLKSMHGFIDRHLEELSLSSFYTLHGLEKDSIPVLHDYLVNKKKYRYSDF